MKREYVAFVEGRPGAPKGTWRQWLQLSRDELRQQVLSETQARAAGSEAREAITHYEVIAEYPLAGRQGLRHQTAAPARNRPEASNPHPGRERRTPLDRRPHLQPRLSRTRAFSTSIDFPRQALHAEILNLEHPGQSGKA